MAQSKDHLLADGIIKRIVREKKAQPHERWDRRTWKAVWKSAIVDEIRRHRKEGTGSSPRAEAIYEAYPRKVGKRVALKAITNALKVKPYEELLEATEAFARCVEKWSVDYRFNSRGVDTCPHPSSWFNAGRYDDDRKEWRGDRKRGGGEPGKRGPAKPDDWVDRFMRKMDPGEWQGGNDRVTRLSDSRIFTWTQIPQDLREELS